MYLNKVYVIGNLTRDPEMKALPNGTNVTNFSVATNRKWSKDGQMQEETEYHNIVVFGKVAENCNTYLSKGAQVLVEGRLQTRSWDKDGQKMYRTEIIAENVTFGRKQEAQPQNVPNTSVPYPPSVDDGDIPFN